MIKYKGAVYVLSAKEYVPPYKVLKEIPPEIKALEPKLLAALAQASKKLKIKKPKLLLVRGLNYAGFFSAKDWTVLFDIDEAFELTQDDKGYVSKPDYNRAKKHLRNALDTVMHEAVHAWQIQYKKKGVGELGGLHDKEFWRMAKSIGVKEKPWYG